MTKAINLETYGNPQERIASILKTEPSVINGEVNAQRYRVTIELIDEPAEVIAERLQVLLKQRGHIDKNRHVRDFAKEHGIDLDNKGLVPGAKGQPANNATPTQAPAKRTAPARKIKAFAGSISIMGEQTKVLVGATSQKAAAEIAGVSAFEVRTYWTWTGSSKKVRAAIAMPGAILIEVPKGSGNGVKLAKADAE